MIAGIDPGTKSIGFAGTDGWTSTLITRSPADDRGRRLDEIDDLVRRALIVHPPRPLLVVVEGPSLHSPGPLGLTRSSEARGIILRRLFLHAIPFVEVSPSALKRFATGNGAADKAAMIAAATDRGADVDDDNAADAFHLRRLGRVAYGLEPYRHDHERDIAAAVTWPVLPSIDTASKGAS